MIDKADDKAGGQGEKPKDDSDRHHKREDLRMMEQALRHGWIFPDNTQTIVPREVVKILLRVGDDGERLPQNSETTRLSLRAAGIIREMQEQNLRIEQGANVHQHLHIHGKDSEGVTILEHDDWYGNHDRIAAETSKTPTADSETPGTVQGSKLRTSLGENGNGSHRGDKGTRPDS